MNSQILGLRVAGSIFGLVGLLQLWRLIARVDLVVGGNSIPLWPSVVVFVITAALCLWLWGLSKQKSKSR